MYNRYVPNGNGYTRVAEPEGQSSRARAQDRRSAAQSRSSPGGISSSSDHHPQARSTQQVYDLSHDRAPSNERSDKEPEKRPRQQGHPSSAAQGMSLPHQQRVPPPSAPAFSLPGHAPIRASLTALADIFRSDDLDSGDILLILILLFLFRDGDDIELMIALGLILLLGLGDKNKENADRQNTVGI